MDHDTVTDRRQHLARILFALAMIGLGALALVYSRLGMVWYSIPDWVPFGAGVTLLSAVLLLGSGIGLVFDRTALLSAGTLLSYLVVWLLMRIPDLVMAPLTAVGWENAAEIGTMVAGAWVVLANLAASKPESKWRGAAGAGTVNRARILFGLSLVAFGISHFAYVALTANLVPAWLPFRTGWVYLTGAAHAAAGLGVLFSIYPRLAATLEAIMLSAFTVLVWVPAILAKPSSMPTWTEIAVSFGVTAGAAAMAAALGRGGEK